MTEPKQSFTEEGAMKNKFSEYLRYDAETGKLFWKKRNRFQNLVGEEAGVVTKDTHTNYKQVSFFGVKIRAHRIIWEMHYGETPRGMIDHINGNGLDNRIENLRLVSSRENQQNQAKHRRGRLVGASFYKNVWRARIRINKKQIHLGTFKTELEAHNAYMDELKKLESK